MNINNVLQLFLEYIPEIVPVYKQKFQESLLDENDGQYVIWSFCINPLIVDMLRNRNKNNVILERVFNFFERMACSEQEDVVELLLYGVLEEFCDDKEILGVARTYMQPQTLTLSVKIQNFLECKLPM